MIPDVVQKLDRDGFVFPYDVTTEEIAAELLTDLEAAEAELANREQDLALLHSYPDRLLPSFDKLVRHPRLIAAAEQILGPDLMVWSCGLFIKDANSSSYVSWHQDLTYWGLNDADEITAWFALSHSNTDSGCMRFLPGSHKRQLVPHVDSFAEGNLLSRGQEIAVKFDDSEAVDVVLKAGEVSLHHGHLFHASGPNRTQARRIGAAIRYIKPSMRQTSGDKSLVALVNGSDRYGNFTIAQPPQGRLLDSDLTRCRTDLAIKSRVLYDGAKEGAGTRYR
ncbi:MAG: ectoine hydroxylase-related dioxygenase (phytanoyl-CoA dioxygenase family) [Gammaproteobacteria bacterium]|jgi:ectoine hydroxylase-related dioxygenase (phytanoyl-CoA dioxygenase family)